MQYQIYHGDNRDVLKAMEDNSIDSIVTDPPYELGFMGKSWDASGIAFNTEVWQECLRVLKPGGHLLAFSGSRTYHRMAVAIEDAGFEIRDQIMWIYGSGFPKSLDVSKAIDKSAGAEREVVGSRITGAAMSGKTSGIENGQGGTDFGSGQNEIPITAPATAEAKQWQGWGTALKPAHEPIVVARKPLIGTVAANVLTYGTGGLNIDGARVISDDWDEKTVLGKYRGNNEGNDSVTGNFGVKEIKSTNTDSTLIGRWPANVIHDGIESEWSKFFYCAKASKRDRNEGIDSANHHPTVKPTDLMRYLCRLVTPPSGTVLDPFMGSGSTGKAAIYEGFNFVGIEMTDEYLPIAKARIEFALKEINEQETNH